jgi:PAS domain S-box-containing protein/diguanylate cyclase (GGDEF)-like protein
MVMHDQASNRAGIRAQACQEVQWPCRMYCHRVRFIGQRREAPHVRATHARGRHLTGDRRGNLFDHPIEDARAGQLPFPASPALFACLYLGVALACLLLIGTLPWHLVRFGLPDLPASPSVLCVAFGIVVLGTALLVFGLAKRLALARTIIASRTAERDIAMGVIDAAPNAVLVADIVKDGAAIIYANPAFEEITGYSVAEAQGKNCRYLQGSDRQQPEIAEIRSAIERRESARVTLRNYRKDGRMFWNQLRIEPIRNEHGVAVYYVGIINDITATKDALSRLQQVTNLDRLTGVANRYRFFDQVEALINKCTTGCVLVLKTNIARFHEINTSFGYETGDLLLIEIAKRLSMLSGFVVGRLGGDEFVISVALDTAGEADIIVARVHDTLAARFVLPGAELDVRFAIGFAVGEAGDDALTLLRQGGVALHESKLTPLRMPSRYDRQSDARLRSRAKLTRELQQASVEDNFVFYYQPKVTMETGAIIGAEALIRWEHPVFGLQPPDRFIPIAEETGLILDIGTWALRKALSFACRLNQDRASPLFLSVNVSSIQFTHRDMLKLVETLLGETGADPHWITLELTESVFGARSPELIAVFRRLRQMGIGLSIDDFGTGYSSLGYLDSFPLSEIKIDKSFVGNLRESSLTRVIVDAIIKIGRELNVMVTAEGVESAAEVSTLRDLGCPYGQGYFFSEPLQEEEFLKLVGTGGPLGMGP